MDRRFLNVISTVADTALELRTGLAKYWQTALVDQVYRPELHYMRGPGPKWREAHARLAEPNPIRKQREPAPLKPAPFVLTQRLITSRGKGNPTRKCP
jgi:hypothetical protein